MKIIKITICSFVFMFLITLLTSQTSFANYSKEKTYTNTSSNISLSEIVELFISLGIIAPDKAQQARSVVEEKISETKKVSSCPSSPFKYNLYFGTTDSTTEGEVTRLQKWLSTMPEIYPEGDVTGYFGPATERAIKKYQAKHGIVSSGSPDTTGYGVLGPKTRGKVNSCINGFSYKYEKNKEEKKKNNETASGNVEKITLQADSENNKVTWETDGYSSKGFKVVWSKNSAPTYPTRSGDKYHYLSNPSSNSSSLNAFDGEGTYHVRVCEYLGGKCGIYSNEVTIELE